MLATGIALLCMLSSVSPAFAGQSGEWPQTSPDRYNTITDYFIPGTSMTASSCTPNPSIPGFITVGSVSKLNPIFGAGGDCYWKVSEDPGNPSAVGATFWSFCQYWAVEERPDLYTNIVSPTGDWLPDSWIGLLKNSSNYTVSFTPAVGDVVVWPSSYEGAGSNGGHTAYVIGVNSDGSVVIQEMNAVFAGVNGEGDTRELPASVVDGTDPTAQEYPATDGLQSRLYFISDPHGTSTGSNGGSGSTSGTTNRTKKTTSVAVTRRLRGRRLVVTVREAGVRSVSAVAMRDGHFYRFSVKRTGSHTLVLTRAWLPRGNFKIRLSFIAAYGYRARGVMTLDQHIG